MDVITAGFKVEAAAPAGCAGGQTRVHHRVVFDILPGEETPEGPIPEWRARQVVSQTDVLRLLHFNMDRLAARDPGYGRSLAALGMARGGVSTVAAATSALAALAQMEREGVSGLGVTAEAGGKLIATLSVSDLRGLVPERFGALALPVGAFLLLRPGSKTGFTWEDALLDRLPPAAAAGRWEEALAGAALLVAVAPTATVREVVAVMVREGKHRVYVCDEEGRAVGVVTPTDVLHLVVADRG